MIKQLVLLLFPRTGIDPLRPQPPLSLLALAPYIEGRELTPVVIDQRVECDTADRLAGLLPQSLFVCVTSMTGEQLSHAIELIELVKALSPATPVVFGGIHASLLPEQAAALDGVDLVVFGEGEAVLPELVDHYQGKRALDGIRGICYRRGGELITTPGRELLDLERLELPAWHLVDLSKYTDITLQCGRGCPHTCSFCYNPPFNRGVWRARSPASILEEMELLNREYGVEEFHLIDDNLFTDFDRMIELCELIVKSGLRIRWKGSFRSDGFRMLTPELVALLKKSGLRLLFVGGESGSPAILKRINKKIRVEDLVAAAEVSRRFDLPTSISFVSGFPFETAQDREMTYRLMDEIKRINPDISIEGANVYTPYPGTELYEVSRGYGLVEPASLQEWAGFVFNRSNLPWFTQRENATMENISFISRFVFWDRSIRERFLKVYYYPFYWFLRLSALLRWRWRFFRLAPEWDLFRWLSRKL